MLTICLLRQTQASLDGHWLPLRSASGRSNATLLPFTYLGLKHELLSSDHLYVHQEAYLAKVSPAVADCKENLKHATRPLSPTEHHSFRSTLCSLLWLCLTRMDIVADVVTLQQNMVTPVISDLISVNALLKRALASKHMNGLHFHFLPPPLKILSTSDDLRRPRNQFMHKRRRCVCSCPIRYERLRLLRNG